jgi:hypothetical protein
VLVSVPRWRALFSSLLTEQNWLAATDSPVPTCLFNPPRITLARYGRGVRMALPGAAAGPTAPRAFQRLVLSAALQIIGQAAGTAEKTPQYCWRPARA